VISAAAMLAVDINVAPSKIASVFFVVIKFPPSGFFW
jgi:hypothetical protein